MPQALEVIAAWGFAFKTVAFTWAKSNAAGRFPIGCGYWTRSNPEMCLFATRGRRKRIARDVRQLLSRKRPRSPFSRALAAKRFRAARRELETSSWDGSQFGDLSSHLFSTPPHTNLK